MTILITGANGFLGYHVRREFRRLQADILTPTSSDANLLHYERLSEYLAAQKPRTILHMAAKCGGLLANRNNPAAFLHANTQMALNVYEAARTNGITDVYTLGSVCAYPDRCSVPFKEESIWEGFPSSTNAPYGQSKRTLMMLGQAYRQQYSFTGCHLIPVNMYGERDLFDLTNSHVIPALIKRMYLAMKNGDRHIRCFGTGNATREFLYAGDCAQAIVKAVMTGLDTDLPINLGIGQDISIRDLACLIKELMGYEGEIIFTNEVSDGQAKRLLDVSRAKEMLNWQATTDLRTGLIRTIDWFRANPS